MTLKAYLLHALSPLHAGTGNAADVIDLPIARMKATGMPMVPGSSVKGKLREARRSAPNGAANDWAEKHFATFGPDKENAGAHAGALVVGDARLLAMPVRSFKGSFVWVTCPLLLTLAQRDMGTTWTAKVPHDLTARGARVTDEARCLHGDKLFLQDLDLPANPDETADEWASLLAPIVSPPGHDILTSRFAIIDDDTMTFLWETATQVDARIRINHDTGTVADGALWLEESLPPDSLLIGLMDADKARRGGSTMSAQDVHEFALPREQVLNFGGKATIGRGRCRILRLESSASTVFGGSV